MFRPNFPLVYSDFVNKRKCLVLLTECFCIYPTSLEFPPLLLCYLYQYAGNQTNILPAYSHVVRSTIGSLALEFDNLDTDIDVSSNQLVDDVIYTITTNNDSYATVSMTTSAQYFDLDPSNDSTYFTMFAFTKKLLRVKLMNTI